MGTTVRSGSQGACLSAPGLGITGAGDMARIGVGQAIGVAVDGVAQAGAMDMEAGATAAATLEATPVADFMAAEVSTVKAVSTVVEAFMVEADSMAEVVSTEVVATVADTGK